MRGGVKIDGERHDLCICRPFEAPDLRHALPPSQSASAPYTICALFQYVPCL